MDGHTVQEKEMATMTHMKTIDGDYCDGYYGWKGVKRVAVFREKAEGRGVHASRPRDHGRARAARQRAGHTTRANVWQPTRVRVAGSVLVTSGGCRARLADVAHRSGAAVKASTSIE
jgi:hypothetical protein